jgi:transposase
MYKYFLGIDISKDSFDFCFTDETEKVLYKDHYQMDSDDFSKLLDYLAPFSNSEILIVMEATGIYHLNLLSYLLEQGLNVSVVNPMFIHAFTKSLSIRKTKTDAKDAHTISIFAKRNYMTLRLSSDLDLETIKPIVREKEKLINQISAIKTDIKSIVNQLFPEMLKNTNIFSKSSLNLLLQAPSKRIIRNLKERTIKRYLSTDITKGAKPKLSASELLSLAKNSIGINNKSLETVLVSKIKQLFFMQSQLEEFNQLIESFVDEHHNDHMDLLTSIPGVGKPSAASFLTELGDINHFKTHKQLTAFIGTDPSVFQSGSSVNGRSSISKRGNAHLRRTIWHMARASTVWSQTFKAYYDKKRSEGKTFKQSVIAVANKLIRIIFSILKNHTKFEDNFSSLDTKAVSI